MTSIVGFFRWTREYGRLSYHVVDCDAARGALPETEKARKSIIVAQWPITQEEWNMGIDALSRRYPVPEELKSATDDKPKTETAATTPK